MKGKKVVGLVGDLAPVEASFALKQLVEGQGGVVECRTDGSKLPAGNRGAYVGTASIQDIDTAETILLVGTNPAVEAPVLNARIRKAWLAGAHVGVIGTAHDLTYDYHHIGADRAALSKFASEDFSDKPKGGIIVVGQGALTGEDGMAVLGHVMKVAEAAESRLLILHTAASRVGAMDVGAVNDDGMGAVAGAEVIYNLGADEVEIAEGPFVIYQGSHGDRGAHRADVILPAAAWTEENGLFVNTEGRPQMALRAGFAPGEAKENWAILRALSAELDAVLPFDSVAQLRRAMVEAVPHLAQLDTVPANEWTTIEAGTLGEAAFAAPVSDFYLTNPIARASEVMADLSARAKARHSAPMAAE